MLHMGMIAIKIDMFIHDNIVFPRSVFVAAAECKRLTNLVQRNVRTHFDSEFVQHRIILYNRLVLYSCSAVSS